MLLNQSTANIVAQKLLETEAVKLSADNYFTWASGKRSPIYCDNRITLSFPKTRQLIYRSFVDLIQQKAEVVHKIAGVATGGIAHGVLVANEMGLPFVYVRSEAKKHGMGNLIEGKLNPGEKVFVIEDLVSTGGSSLQAVEALRETGAEVVGMAAIFTYGFQAAADAFEKANCPLYTLSDYPSLIRQAAEMKYIEPSQIAMLEDWYKNA